MTLFLFEILLNQAFSERDIAFAFETAYCYNRTVITREVLNQPLVLAIILGNKTSLYKERRTGIYPHDLDYEA
jgi:hypothetical protein